MIGGLSAVCLRHRHVACTSLLYACSPLYVACQHGHERLLFTATLSCFSSLGSSLRLVGSALSDRDVSSSPDYCDTITTQNKQTNRKKNVQDQSFQKLRARLQISNREGALSKNLMHCLFSNF